MGFFFAFFCFRESVKIEDTYLFTRPLMIAIKKRVENNNRTHFAVLVYVADISKFPKPMIAEIIEIQKQVIPQRVIMV